MKVFHCCRCHIYFEGIDNHICASKAIFVANDFEHRRIAAILADKPDIERPLRLTERDFLAYHIAVKPKPGKTERRVAVILDDMDEMPEMSGPDDEIDPEIAPLLPRGYKMTPEQISDIYRRAGKYGPGAVVDDKSTRDRPRTRALQGRSVT